MVKFVVTHSETQEKLVVYQNAVGGEHHIRPLDMFLEDVTVDGNRVQRFELQVPTMEAG